MVNLVVCVCAVVCERKTIYLSIHVSIYLSKCFHLSIYLSIYLFFLSIFLYVVLTFCVSEFLSFLFFTFVIYVIFNIYGQETFFNKRKWISLQALRVSATVSTSILSSALLYTAITIYFNGSN